MFGKLLTKLGQCGILTVEGEQLMEFVKADQERRSAIQASKRKKAKKKSSKKGKKPSHEITTEV